MTKNAPARTPALKKAQAKYGSTLRQFKFALSRERDMTLIALLENIPNLKNWAINHIRKENRKFRLVTLSWSEELQILRLYTLKMLCIEMTSLTSQISTLLDS